MFIIDHTFSIHASPAAGVPCLRVGVAARRMEVRIGEGPESPQIELEKGKSPAKNFGNCRVSKRRNSDKSGKKPVLVGSLADCIRAKYEEKNHVEEEDEEEQAEEAAMMGKEKEEIRSV